MGRKRFLMLIIGTIIPFFEPAAQVIEMENEMQANEDDMEILSDENGTSLDSIIGYLPESLNDDMFKLLDDWHVRYLVNPDEFCEDQETNPSFPDSEYKMRMERMMTVIPMTYNETVRRCIDVYTGRNRRNLRYTMGMADFYFPMIEQILDTHQLPLELKYLAVVESALNPIAQSRVGASGIWQFMLPTGKIHGLEINSLIDERLDPERATEAACNYFKEMYELYGDWYLSIAAYNCGAGSVNRAIRRAGGSRDFWKIFPYLPRETRSYVPLFIAAAYIMTYHCEHNICPVRADFSIVTDTIMVERALHFDQIAEILQMDKETIRFYNPQYKREIIPGNIRPSILRLPIDKTFTFVDREDSVYAHRMEELLAHCLPADMNNRQEQITHTVKAGETLYTIANLYGVTIQNLRRWNGLSGSRVAQGRRLRVTIDNGGLTFAAQNATSTPASTTRAQNTGDNAGTVSHHVKSGDTLYAIARKYPGVTVQSIQRANGLNTTRLRIGQILQIK